MTQNNTYMAIYRTFAEVDEAIRKLADSGFEVERISVIGKDDGTGKHMAACYNTGDGLKYHARSDHSWEGMRSLLSGWGFFWSLDSGPVHVVGPLAQLIVETQEGIGAMEGMSAIGAAMSGMGLPEGSVAEYEKALRNNRIVLCARGDLDDMDRAHEVLVHTKPLNGTLHHDGAG